MDTANPAAASEEMDLSGRAYTVFGSLALLAGPIRLSWALVVILAIDVLHRHLALIGAK
jgi:hypothetical protein